MLDYISFVLGAVIAIGTLLTGYFVLMSLYQYLIRRVLKKNLYIWVNVLTLLSLAWLKYWQLGTIFNLGFVLEIIFCLCFILYGRKEEKIHPWFYYDRTDIKKLPLEQRKKLWQFFSRVDCIFLSLAAFGLLGTIFVDLGMIMLMILFLALALWDAKTRQSKYYMALLRNE